VDKVVVAEAAKSSAAVSWVIALDLAPLGTCNWIYLAVAIFINVRHYAAMLCTLCSTSSSRTLLAGVVEGLTNARRSNWSAKDYATPAVAHTHRGPLSKRTEIELLRPENHIQKPNAMVRNPQSAVHGP